MRLCLVLFFFFNDTATTEIYTLSLHDALPISAGGAGGPDARSGGRTRPRASRRARARRWTFPRRRDRKSTRLNSSHGYISYAVFCLKKKKKRGPGGRQSVEFRKRPPCARGPDT